MNVRPTADHCRRPRTDGGGASHAAAFLVQGDGIRALAGASNVHYTLLFHFVVHTSEADSVGRGGGTFGSAARPPNALTCVIRLLPNNDPRPRMNAPRYVWGWGLGRVCGLTPSSIVL